MKIKSYLYLSLIITGIIFFFLNIHFNWLIILLPNQNIENINLENCIFLFIVMKNYSIETTQILNTTIIIELLSDSTQYDTENIFSTPNFIFTLLNGLLMGSYLNSIGLIFSSKKKNQILLFVAIWIFFSVFGLFGIRLILNFPFLLVNTYESNTVLGCLFFIGNILYFLIIWILSLLIEVDT